VTEEVNCCVWVVTVTAARFGETVRVTLGFASLGWAGVVGAGLPVAFVPAGVLPVVAVNALLLVSFCGLDDDDVPIASAEAAVTTMQVR
jgi:hypothetical protein